MSILSIFSVSLGAILIENVVLSNLLGITPFLNDSKGIRPAVKTGVAVAVSITVASVLSCIIDWAIISPLSLGYMRTVIYVLVVSIAVTAVEKVLKAKSPKVYERLGVSFPLVAANAAVVGAMLLTSNRGYNLFEALIFGISAGIGYIMAISLFAAVRERLEYSDVPKSLEGLPIALITAGLIALAFSGFSGMKFM